MRPFVVRFGKQLNMSRTALRNLVGDWGSERKVLWAVLLGSLVLSCIATVFNPIIARDAALYLDIGRLYLEGGLQASLARFDWPWFPILIAKLHHYTGVNAELFARLLCEMFTAIACLLCVDMVRRTRKDLLLWSAMVVLAIPAFNAYRGDILRENGFWCFSMLAVWSMQCWVLYRHARYLLLGVLAILLAAIFRLEAVYLLLVVPAYFVLSMKGSPVRRGLIILLALTLVVGAATLLVWARARGYLPAGRISDYVARLDVKALFEHFELFAGQLAQLMPFEYARDDAAQILFAGLCIYLLIKLLNMLGILVIPWAVGLRSGKRSTSWLLPDIALVGYCLVLLVFLVDHLFLSLRYVVFSGFLLVPRISQGMQVLAQARPRLKTWMAGALMLLALANVVSTSAPKTQVRDAGIWVGQHLPRGVRLYMEDNRIAYFAGWGYGTEVLGRDQALALEGLNAYKYFALSLKHKHGNELEALKQKGLSPIAEFKNRKGDTYIILRRGP
jgi:hypothetical protein